MADYNSPWTGPEIDEAIAKTQDLTEIKLIWTTTDGVTGGIPLSNLPAKPDGTGHAGLYYVVISDAATDVTQPNTKTVTSTIFIGNVDGQCSGAAAVGMDSDSIYSVKAKYNISGDKKIHGYGYEHLFSGTTATETELYIHRIYRKERTVVSSTTASIDSGF